MLHGSSIPDEVGLPTGVIKTGSDPKKADAFYKPVKHVNLGHMKTVTVRDLRQRWPETEKALQTEQEILVTRDSKPVAKLVRYVEPDKPRKRFDPTSHGKWQQKMSRGEITRWVDEGLIKERDEG